MTKRRLSVQSKSSAIMALFIIGCLSLALVTYGAVANVWAPATTRQPVPHTALSFLNTGHLPTYAPAGVPQHMTFRIVNHEASIATYRYRVVMNTGQAVAVLSEGAVTLKDQAAADNTIAFTLPRPDMRAQITVQLLDRTEYLTFGAAS